AARGRAPAGDRGTRAGLDGLTIFEARLAEVGVHIDEAGEHHASGGIDHLEVLGRLDLEVPGDGSDPPVTHQHVATVVDVVGGIDDGAAADQQGVDHPTLRSKRGGSTNDSPAGSTLAWARDGAPSVAPVN